MIEQLKSKNFRTNLLLGLFIASIIASNLLGGKIAEIVIFGVPIIFSVGLVAFAFTFPVTDVIAEVYGRKKAQEFVYIGLAALIFVLIVTVISVNLPYAERSWITPEQYGAVFDQSIRILIASIVAFFISQMHDVFSFEFWKEKTQGKMLWLRNNLSTIVSQAIDSTIFMFIAFYQVSPKYDVGFIVSLIIPYYILKVGLAIIDTPVVYAIVNWLKSAEAE
ncbi:MAG: transporter [Candidatus Diapherotrites archaeon]|uniref:Probable queuosine precursor transporter n=1 Tax=Candidatus Iainarchaeum sp. TaxID=3101447 RepID=A0A2D6M1Q3_9ARCH|nr:transporter [Candidatus Diapherotrites archaeon]|tara:strand:+ start:176 stop:838 length:663 start_codon:yes stop_codon:yes gene_type:complete